MTLLLVISLILLMVITDICFSKYRHDREGKVYRWRVAKREFMETRYNGLEHMLGGFRENGRTQPVEIRVFFVESLGQLEQLIRSPEDQIVILKLIELISLGYTDFTLIESAHDVIKRFPLEQYSFWHPVRH